MKPIQTTLVGILPILFAACTPSEGEPTATSLPPPPTNAAPSAQPAEQGILSGFVWQDKNLDNQVNEDEKLAEVQVTLTSGEACRTAIASTISDADGSFTFAGLPAGSYCLTGMDGEITISQAGLNLDGDQQLTGVILTFPPLRPPPTTISGIVYLDLNGDGEFNQDEPRVPEHEVVLRSGACGENGPSLTSVLSGPDGIYTLIGDFNGRLCLQSRTDGEQEGAINFEVTSGQALEGLHLPIQDN